MCTDCAVIGRSNYYRCPRRCCGVGLDPLATVDNHYFIDTNTEKQMTCPVLMKLLRAERFLWHPSFHFSHTNDTYPNQNAERRLNRLKQTPLWMYVHTFELVARVWQTVVLIDYDIVYGSTHARTLVVRTIRTFRLYVRMCAQQLGACMFSTTMGNLRRTAVGALDLC